MNLIEFAILFEPHYPRKPCDDEENIDEDAYKQPQQSRRRLIALIDNSKIVVGKKPCVVRVPSFNAQADLQTIIIAYFSNTCRLEMSQKYCNISIHQKMLS